MAAWDYLSKKGYKILDKNYRCKIGEIDVVAKKKGQIVFIEIKTRTSADFGDPEESVHPFKRRKLVRLAEWYLKDKKLEDSSARFDVVSILWKDSGDPEIRLIENAFSVDNESR